MRQEFWVLWVVVYVGFVEWAGLVGWGGREGVCLFYWVGLTRLRRIVRMVGEGKTFGTGRSSRPAVIARERVCVDSV